MFYYTHGSWRGTDIGGGIDVRWRVWYRETHGGHVYRSQRSFKTRAQALTSARLHVDMRASGMFGGQPVQFRVRRVWRRSPRWVD